MTKDQLISQLQDEFNRWAQVLGGLSEAERNTPISPSTMTVKDTLAHLRAWQQVSIARLQAALDNTEPTYPDWTRGMHPDTEDMTDRFNAAIFSANHDRPWSDVHAEWRDGFLHFLDLARALPEQDYFDREKYPWLDGYEQAGVLEGSYGHHHEEHLGPLLAWLEQRKT